MSITNKIIQWNPTGGNQESDAAYAADTQRSGGALAGQDLFYNTANKLWYQTSSMVAALAQALANKGIATDGSNFDDASFANLVTALSNLLTPVDFVAAGVGSYGYLKIPIANIYPAIIIQWGLISERGQSTSAALDFSTPFAYQCYAFVCSLGYNLVLTGDASVGGQAISLSQYKVTISGGNPADTYGGFWIAIGQ